MLVGLRFFSLLNHNSPRATRNCGSSGLGKGYELEVCLRDRVCLDVVRLNHDRSGLGSGPVFCHFCCELFESESGCYAV